MNYTFKIQSVTPGIIDEYVHPDNQDKLDIIPYNTEGQRFIRNKINANIILSGDEYTLVYGLLTQYKCEQFRFIIQRVDQTTPIFTGLFTYFNIGTINEDKCYFDFSMITDDIYTRFMNVWKDEYNILNTNQLIDGVSEVTNPVCECRMDLTYETEEMITDYYVVIYNNSIYYSTVPNGTSPWDINDLNNILSVSGMDDWRIKAIDTARMADNNLDIPAGYTVLYKDNIAASAIFKVVKMHVVFEREVLRYPEINGVWQTPPITVPAWTFRHYEVINGNNNKVYSRYFDYVGHYEYSGYYGSLYFNFLGFVGRIIFVTDSMILFTNCRRLRHVINYMLTEMGYSNHQSLFFYSDPNPVTQETGRKLFNLLVGQKSDFISPIGSDMATIATWSMERLCNTLRDQLNVYWYFDNGILKFEHETFFENGLSYAGEQTLDVIIDDYLLEETNKYNIAFEQLFGRETFENVEQDGVDFIGVPIKYLECITERNSEKNTIVSDVTTDIVAVYNNKGGISEDGLVLLQTIYNANATPNYYIENENGILAPSKSYTNGHLAWAMLQNKYFKTGVRLLSSFNMNGVIEPQSGVTILAKKLKIKDEIVLPFCGYQMNFYAHVKINDLPPAKMIDARFNLNSEYLTLKLAYDV